jgi:hypothetical protein
MGASPTDLILSHFLPARLQGGLFGWIRWWSPPFGAVEQLAHVRQRIGNVFQLRFRDSVEHRGLAVPLAHLPKLISQVLAL